MVHESGADEHDFQPLLTRQAGPPAPFLALRLQQGEVMRETGRGQFLQLDGGPSAVVLIDGHRRLVMIGLLHPNHRAPEQFASDPIEAAVDYDEATDTVVVRVVELPPAVRLVRYGWLDLLFSHDDTFVGIRVFQARKHLQPEVLPTRDTRNGSGEDLGEALPERPSALTASDAPIAPLSREGPGVRDGVWVSLVLPLLVDLKLGPVVLASVELVEYTMRPAMDKSRARLVVDAQRLRESGASYGGTAVVDDPRDGQRLFTGIVRDVNLDSGAASIVLEGLEAELAEVTTRGLVVPAGNDGLEILYAIVRNLGITDDRMNLEGFQPGPQEAFLVVAPVAGAALAGTQTISDVVITDSNPAQLDAFPGDLAQEFSAASVWAYTPAVAETLYAVEEIGLQKLDDALSVLQLLLRFDHSAIDGELKLYSREANRAQVELRDIVLVVSFTSSRRWLRSTTDIDVPAQVEMSNHVPAWSSGVTIDADLQSAIREWSKAARASDRLSAVSHLWRSIESYAASTQAPALFDATDRKRLRAAMGNEWNEYQRERLDRLVQQLNDAPLSARLQTALTRDGVRLTDADLALLLETRQLRNELEHGRGKVSAQDREANRRVAQALSIMNRVLVQRIRRTDSRTQKPS